MRRKTLPTSVFFGAICITVLFICYGFYITNQFHDFTSDVTTMNEVVAKNDYIITHSFDTSSKSTTHDDDSSSTDGTIDDEEEKEGEQQEHKHEEEQEKQQEEGPPKDKAPVVAYAVSFVKCGDHQNSAAGLIDASIILRHSIHKISSRNPSSGSKYDYKMYAIVHRPAEPCTQVLEKVGFEVILVDRPIKLEDIRGDFLRKHIRKERCCGHDEFIKLEAYRLPADIIVHVDLDFAFYKPMDHLFDAILYSKDSPEGAAARSKIELERPGEKLPDKIGAYWTRDWPQVVPGKYPPGYQAGFLVARHDPSIMEEIVEVIKEGNYTEGWGWNYGWGSKGYGGWVGAMAMQGVVAYYYDHIRKDNAVELNQCLYNHMGMYVTHRGKCRNGAETCEDCTKTPMEDIYSMHYTMCRKPWLCQATGTQNGKKPGGGRGSALNLQSVVVNHCLEMATKWHSLRSDFESSLLQLTNDKTISDGQAGEYKKEIFQGHCKEDGSEHYVKLSVSDDTMKRVEELYHH